MAEALLTDLARSVRPQHLLSRARAAGLPVNRRHFVPLAVLLAGGEHAREESRRVARITGGVLGELRLPGLIAHLGGRGAITLMSLPRDEDTDVAVQQVAERLRERLRPLGRSVIGVGHGCLALDQVGHSVREAIEVADAAVDAPDAAGGVVRLRDLRLLGLVRQLSEVPQLQAFTEREVGPLLDDRRRDLLPILRTYLTTDRNKSLTAKHHHLSRPALYRRLDGIQQLLGIDLDDFTQAASVYVAPYDDVEHL